MAYSQQSFSVGQIFTAAQANKIETNIVDHQHGVGSINEKFGPISVNSIYIGNRGFVDHIAIGEGAMSYQITASSASIAIGKNAMSVNSNGSANVAIGHQSMMSNKKGSRNVAVGFEAMNFNVDDNDNVAIGYSACRTMSGGGLNVAIGSNALKISTTGASNVVVGNSAGSNNTSGDKNTLLGDHAGASNSTGENNVFVGANAGDDNTTGESNVAVGVLALGFNTTASYNTAVGHFAMVSNITGYRNTAVGFDSLDNCNSFHNCTGLGAKSAVTGNDQVQLGDSATTTYAYGAVQNRSDKRDKTQIQSLTLGLDFINQLIPRNYKWDYREDYDWKEKDGSKTRKRFHHGLIAQEVEQVCEDMGIDFGGLQHHEKAGGKDVYSLGYEELIAPLIKAVQELTQRVDELEKA